VARPIQPTPVVTGEDADALMASVENVASPEEIARRKLAARRFLQTVTRSQSNDGHAIAVVAKLM
jgi:hypothetical protein